MRGCETVLEAPLQTIVNFVYLKKYAPGHCEDIEALGQIWNSNNGTETAGGFFNKMYHSYKDNCAFPLVSLSKSEDLRFRGVFHG